MARVIGKLSAIKVEKTKKPGLYGDGGGLWLRVTNEGAKNWLFRFMLNKRARTMGLGPVSLYGLQEAREMAREARKLRHQGVDPIDARRTRTMEAKLENAKTLTFQECADAYIKSHKAGWRNAKHIYQWEATLHDYAGPIIGALSVQAIDTALVMRVLGPLWTTKPETASRLRGRIEAVLDWAKIHGYREGENPARWKGYLDKALPKRSEVQKVEHYAALHYGELPAFLTVLRSQEATAARALEFTILTAARTGEVLGMRWSEVAISEALWTVPAARMKTHKEHRVPLSAAALAIVEKMRASAPESGPDAFVFPGAKHSRPLSNTALIMLLRRLQRGDLTVHGFRSTFSDWVTECTNFPSEVREMALAHAVGNKVEEAYRRGDLFQKRRALMDAWAYYCGPAGDKKIVNLKRTGLDGEKAVITRTLSWLARTT
jgi:integrase